MSLEDRIRNELHDTAERLALDPGEYRRAIEDAARRRQRRLLAAGVASAGVVVALAAGVFLLRPGDSGVVASTTSPATTAPPPVTTALPVAADGGVVVVAGSNGLTWAPLGSGVPGGLKSDHYYETISWAAGDGNGGLIFTHEVTPLPWDQGTLLWLPAGEPNPRPLAAPPPQSLITPIGVSGERAFYRLDHLGGSEVYSVPLTGGEPTLVVPATDQMIGASLAGDTIVIASGGECGGLASYTTGGDALGGAGCEDGSVIDLAFTGDFLFTIEDGAEGRVLRRFEWATGESVTSPIEGWQVEALSPDQVAVGGESVSVGRFSGDSFEPGTQVTNPGTFALVDSLSIASNATLGSGLGEWPCTPLDLPAPAPQAVPDAVNEKRAQMFALAASCDLEGLAEIVTNDGAAFTFGDQSDPVRSWVREARYGHDVLSMTVRLFNAEPAQDGLGVWAWPAVHATGTEDDWQALSGVLSAAEFEQFYQSRDSGYLGLRIGIDPDGRLTYLVAGD